MEKQIFEMIVNAGGLAIALSLLFFYSIYSFRTWKAEREDLKAQLKSLQNDFHSFKNDVISKLFLTVDNSTEALEKISDCFKK